MLGPVLPVELVTSSRRARYYLVRVGYAAIVVLILWLRFESDVSAWQAGDGRVAPSELSRFAGEFFETFAIVQLSAILLLTPALVAGTVAEEKDRRTLEYLLTSDLGNAEIVLGKLAARLLHLLAVVSVAWPIIALLMLLGGLSFERVLAVSIVTASTAGTVGALSIWTSVQARRARDAVMRVFVIGFALLTVPPILAAVTGVGWFDLNAAQPLVDAFNAANPIVYFVKTANSGFADWRAAAVLVRNQCCLAVPCVVWSVGGVRRVYLRQVDGRRARGGRRWRIWRPKLRNSALLWKELVAERSSFSLGITGLIAQAVLIVAVLGPALYLFLEKRGRAASDEMDDLCVYVFVVGSAVATLGLLVVAARAATSVTGERERQTWELLLSTPVEPSELVRAKIIGSLFAMRGLVMLAGVLMVLGVAARSTWIPMIAVTLAGLAILAVFAAALGLVFSLAAKTSLRAMAGTIAAGAFLGGGYLFCCLPLAWGGADGAGILAGCIPFLLGMPLAYHPTQSGVSSNEAVELWAAWAMGVLAYAVAGGTLLMVALGNFDLFTGRVRPRGGMDLARANRPERATRNE